MLKTVPERIAAINAECSGCWGVSGVNQWERDRLKEWEGRASLSDKQEKILKQIEAKVFDGGEE
jgi:hypothetical protein